jgi:SAM-dependent methyltransferase
MADSPTERPASNPKQLEAPCPICGAALGSVVIHDGTDRLLGLGGNFQVRECTSCELGVSFPRLSGEDLSRHYPDEYGPYRPARGLMARVIGRWRSTRADAVLRTQPFAALLGAEPSGSMLDVGCGRGDMAGAFARRGWSAYGVDPSLGAVEAARELGVEATVGTLADAPGQARECDIVIFNHALEHLPDPRADLMVALERLRPGGHLVIAVPDWSSWQRKRFGAKWFHLDLPRHIHHFSPRALERVARDAGFEPETTRGATSLVGLVGSIQYEAFGRCVFRGPRLRVGLALAFVLYPLTLLVGHMAGGDTLYFTARRPA